MILTGDVNLMSVEDSHVPFARVQEDLHAVDVVFSKLECCLYDPPHGHATETEGFYASPQIGGPGRGRTEMGLAPPRHARGVVPECL